AIHSALRVAAAVARNLRNTVHNAAVPPADGLAWRNLIDRPRPSVTLENIAVDLWSRGIPVIPLDVLRTLSFYGLAAIVDIRPVIVLGQKHDEPGRLAHVVAHEAGNIAAGDCTPNQPVVDEDDEIRDNSAMERQADQYANHVLIGEDRI